MKQPDFSGYLTLSELAKRWKCTRAWVSRLHRDGRIKGRIDTPYGPLYPMQELPEVIKDSAPTANRLKREKSVDNGNRSD